jgi:hypothetical protein
VSRGVGNEYEALSDIARRLPRIDRWLRTVH